MIELVNRWQEQQKREDLRAGQIAQILLNIHRDRKQRKEPFTAADIFPSLKQEVPTESKIMKLAYSLGWKPKNNA